jgi:hypothetical protein
MTIICSADILWKYVQFVSQIKESKICFLVTPVNTTKYYDSMALMRRQDKNQSQQDKNIFLDWEIFTHDTDKSENVLLFDNVYGSDIQRQMDITCYQLCYRKLN